jgi:transcription elongation factor GreA
MNPERTASGLLRAIGLLPDGPVVWGRPLPPTGAGVFVVEVAAPLATAPIELTRIGKWLERVEGLRVDGERPTSRVLASRIGASWLPSEPVIYIGSSETSVSRKVAAMLATPLGDRRPSSSGHWLHALAIPAGTRVWWTPTKAVEEYEDALFSTFADGVADAERSALHDPASILPFANLRRPTGERRRTGLTGSLLPEAIVAPAPPRRIVQVPDGDADGADGKAPQRRARRTATTRKASPAPVPVPVPVTATPLEPPEEAGALTPDGAVRLRAELDGLIQNRRPEVIAWIRSAKELGDLKENSDYHAARAEQSFLEGRIQAIEARLRTAVIVEAPAAGARIGLGSVVRIETDGETIDYTIVGSSESDVVAGRISSSSPVGRALLGRSEDDEVVIQTPAGGRHYRIVSVT